MEVPSFRPPLQLYRAIAGVLAATQLFGCNSSNCYESAVEQKDNASEDAVIKATSVTMHDATAYMFYPPLRTIIWLASETPPREVRQHSKTHPGSNMVDLGSKHFSLTRPADPTSLLIEAVSYCLKEKNYPVLLLSPTMQEPSAVIALLRRFQRWPLCSILEEWERNCRPKMAMLQTVQMLDLDLISVEEEPEWLCRANEAAAMHNYNEQDIESGDEPAIEYRLVSDQIKYSRKDLVDDDES